ncbi:hypothetical protein [Parasitella parasitica]|uniref:PHD-type domain-containing protein n=1 Tax=Parasitella parasitica TaxID=35722 RepID=A0A0B7N6T4_9FUNG|nr:hypothetical protein [Parasitella parasitica]
MTPPRRTRKSNTSKKPKSSRIVAEDSSDERSSDADSVTRCICGQGHNSGLMVQCDKCEVWQHCECIGLNQDKLPDHYYCDQCQPENHHIVKTSSGRSKRLYNAGLVSTSTTTSPSSNSSDKEDAATSTSTKRPTKRRKKATPADKIGSNSPKTPLIEAKMEQASPVINTIDESCVIEERSTRSRRSKIPADASEQTRLIPELVKKTSSSASSSFPTTSVTKSEKKTTKSKANNRSSSSATPQQQVLDDFGSPTIGTACTSSFTPYWNFTDGRPIRESSPPAKIKYPNSKMTFSDMNKRAKQIMECITKMQSEELKRLPPPTMSLKNNSNALLLFEHSEQQQESTADAATSFNRPRSLSTCSTSSSLSSASTVPLLDDYATTTTSASSSPSTPIPYKHFQYQQQQHKQEEESSIEILERMSREIAKFQRKFGVVYQHYHQHQNGISSNGGPGHAKSSTGSK